MGFPNDYKYALIVCKDRDQALFLGKLLGQDGPPNRVEAIGYGQSILGRHFCGQRPNVLIHAGVPQDERGKAWWDDCVMKSLDQNAEIIDLSEREVM